MLRRCVFALALLVAAGLLHPLMACSCLDSGLACEAWGKADGVFLGRVVDISTFEDPRNDPFPYKETFSRVRFVVESAFRGVAVGTVEIIQGGNNCSYGFELNRRYVVYAYRNADSSFGTSMCSRTRRVENADEDLAFLRSLPTSRPGASVIGQLGLREGALFSSKPRSGPMVGATVTVEGPGGPRSAVSDAQGRYQIAELPPGDYEVKPQSAPGSTMQFEPVSQKVTLVEHGCAQVNAWAQINGRISGFVSDADGRPAPYLGIELLPEAMSPMDRRNFSFPRVSTAEDGSYEFKAIPPGRYLVVLNLSYEQTPLRPGWDVYPRIYFPATTERSEARVIELAAGAEQRGVDIKLPRPLQKREVHGTVVWSDGTKAKGARVFLRNTEYLPGSSLSTEVDADGAFSFSAYEAQPYAIVAESGNAPDGKPLTIKVNSLPTPVRDEQTVVTLPYPATLRGRMVDALGRPLERITLELIPEEARDWETAIHSRYSHAFSNSEGRFEISGLDPGRYVLAVHVLSAPYPNQDTEYPPTFYPGTGTRSLAAVIEVKEGQKSELRDFVLPEKLQVVSVEGIVAWPDGRAIPRGYVVAHDMEFPESSVGSREFGADGRFVLQLFKGRRYEIRATTSKDREGRETLWFFETTLGEMVFDAPVEGLTLFMSEKPQ